jgi:hypothetical protein
MHRPQRRGRGQALVEFALVIPIFLLVVLALFDLGRIAFSYNALTNATREGARLAIVNQDITSIKDRVRAQAFAVDVKANEIVVAFHEPGDADDPTPDDPSTYPECPTLLIGCVAVVEISHPIQPITPVIGNIIGSITLRTVAQMPVELVCPSVTGYFTVASSCPKQP